MDFTHFGISFISTRGHITNQDLCPHWIYCFHIYWGMLWFLGLGLCRLTSEIGVRAKQRSGPWCSGSHEKALCFGHDYINTFWVTMIDLIRTTKIRHTQQTGWWFARRSFFFTKHEICCGKTVQKLLFSFYCNPPLLKGKGYYGCPIV